MSTIASAPTPSSAPPRRRGPAAGVALFTLLCVGVALVAVTPYLTTPLDRLAQSDVGLARHFAAQPEWIKAVFMVHASMGGLALLLAPLQLAPAVRRRAPRAHRIGGRVSGVAILLAASAGLVVAQVSYAGINGTIGFSLLAIAWATSVVLAVRAARGGDLRLHREWAIRTLALTFAAVTLRLWVGLGIGLQAPETDAAAREAFDAVYPFTPFGCWVPNLLIAELVIRRSR